MKPLRIVHRRLYFGLNGRRNKSRVLNSAILRVPNRRKTLSSRPLSRAQRDLPTILVGRAHFSISGQPSRK
ncbi:hypothetical protein KCP78_22975 [Salmonella enterica subsp. enterica]|nr:hypothetical protein KCP78_22975 [Salmonella enterica subsp. enterica]